MISKILLNKKTYFNNFAKQNIWLMIMSLMLTGLTTVFPIVLYMLNNNGNTTRYVSDMFNNNLYLQIVSILLAIITGIVVFKYLNSKSEVDLHHSLAIKKEKIFLARYIYGILSFVIPVIINVFFLYVLAQNDMFLEVPSFIDCSIMVLNITLLYISVFSFSILGTIVTGNIFMSVCTGVGIMFCPVVLVWIYSEVCNVCYKFFALNNDVISKVGMITSPMYQVGRALSYNNQLNTFYLVLQIVVISAISFAYYIKRPEENSSNQVAINIWKTIIKTLGTVCGSVLIGFLISSYYNYTNFNIIMFLIYILISGFTLHLIFESLFELDIKSCFKNLKQFALIYIITILPILVIFLDFGNYDKKIVPIEDISSIEYQGYTLNSTENIEMLYELITYNVENIDTVNNWGSNLVINLKNGKSYTRSYSDNDDKKIYSKIRSSKEYVIKRLGYDKDNIEDLIDDNYEIYYINYDYDINLNDEMYLSDRYLSKQQLVDIYNLIIQKNDDITFEEEISKKDQVLTIYYRGKDGSYNNLPIYSIHKEALEYLRDK